MELARTKIIACATVIEEMLPLLPPEVQTQTLDFGLHLRPEGLRRSLQEARGLSTASQSRARHVLPHQPRFRSQTGSR